MGKLGKGEFYNASQPFPIKSQRGLAIVIYYIKLSDCMDRPEQERISFFLFINTKSGGGVGSEYLSVPNQKITYQFGKDSTISLHFVDLFDAQARG